MYNDLYNVLNSLYQEIQDIYDYFYSFLFLSVIISSISRMGGMVFSSGSAPDIGGSIPSSATIGFAEK